MYERPAPSERSSPKGEATAMTSSIGPLSVFADVAVLLALAAAIANPSVSPPARPVIATFAFAFAWLVTAVLDTTRAPDWAIFLGGAVIVVSIAVITVTLHRWTLGGDDGDSEPGHQGGPGGGGPRRRRPDAPQHGGDGGVPSWWPEFEREFALYVAEREREKERRPVTRPTDAAASLPVRPG